MAVSVGKVFETRKGPFAALGSISLAIKEGEFVTLIGHSGCGKSTLLNLVAGLIQPTVGNMILAGRANGWPWPRIRATRRCAPRCCGSCTKSR